MIKIFEYDKGLAKFHCDKCDCEDAHDFSRNITNDCVLDVEILCRKCGDSSILYFLHCETEYKAKELSVEFELLKSKHGC